MPQLYEEKRKEKGFRLVIFGSVKAFFFGKFRLVQLANERISRDYNLRAANAGVCDFLRGLGKPSGHRGSPAAS